MENRSFPHQENLLSKEDMSFLDEKVLDMKEDALLEDDFIGRLQTEDFVNNAKKVVSNLKNNFEKDNAITNIRSELESRYELTPEYRKKADYLEALLYNKLGGKNGWIPNALVWKTSEYDDYVNGVDFVVETENREFSLAADITFSHTTNLEKKLERIKKRISLGQLPKLDFYESTDGKTIELPHVIIAVEKTKVEKALKFWVDGDDSLLERHPVKAKILLEIEAQLEAFAVHAKKEGKRDIASKYNEMLSQIQRMLSEKEELIKRYQSLIDDDQSYKSIMNFCNKLKTNA